MLFVYSIDAAFVQTDRSLLGAFSNVVPFLFRGSIDYPRLIVEIAKADLVYCWFALGFSAVATTVARVMGRKSIVVAGGWDVTRAPEIGYGRLLYLRGRIGAAVALCQADRILAFSDWSAAAIREVAPNGKISRVYLGVDVEAFRPGPKEDLVVCVCHVSRENLRRKGLRTFIGAASEVPEARFVLVGRAWDDSVDELRKMAPDNVEISGWLQDDELRQLLARAKVYVQVSYVEGFGLALAEAMAAGCVPVVTAAGAIPEVVGRTGIFVSYNDVPSLAAGVRQAIQSQGGIDARNRIIAGFRVDQRAEELRAVIGSLLGQSITAFPNSPQRLDASQTEGGP